MAVDGFTQLLTDRESTAFLRLVTGAPFGFVLGLFFAAAYSARPNKFSEPGQVLLPGNVRFQRPPQEEERSGGGIDHHTNNCSTFSGTGQFSCPLVKIFKRSMVFSIALLS